MNKTLRAVSLTFPFDCPMEAAVTLEISRPLCYNDTDVA